MGSVAQLANTPPINDPVLTARIRHRQATDKFTSTVTRYINDEGYFCTSQAFKMTKVMKVKNTDTFSKTETNSVINIPTTKFY